MSSNLLATHSAFGHTSPLAAFQDIKAGLRQLYLEDKRPWLVGFSGGKDRTMLASLIFDVVLSIPPEQRKKPVSVSCTDTRNGAREELSKLTPLPYLLSPLPLGGSPGTGKITVVGTNNQ